MGNWPIVLLFTITALLFRWHGDAWLVVLTKLLALTILSLAIVLALGGLVL